MFADLIADNQLWLVVLVGFPGPTETFPSGERGYFAAPDVITALGIHGTGIELPMLAVQGSFTLGRGDNCDLRADRQYLAATHARLDRVADRIQVTDISNGKNRIVVNERAVMGFDLCPGDQFVIGKTTYYALNDEMRLARPALMGILGATQYAAVDDVLIAGASEPARHVVILAEPGNDQERLGQTIHNVSPRRRNRFMQIPASSPSERPRITDPQVIRDARDGTLLIWIPWRQKYDPQSIATLTHADARVRLVICAHSLGKVSASIPAAVITHAKHITIDPLRKRKDEIPRLLDHWFVDCRSSLRFAALTDANQRALLAYRWPDNLQELRAAADHLIQLAPYLSERQATLDTTNTTRAESRAWRKRLNVTLPVVKNPLK